MPRGDRTGPMGEGPMTGRAAGFCVGSGQAGYANPGSGRGAGLGLRRGRGGGGGGLVGGGRGRRNRFFATGLPRWMRFGGNEEPIESRGSYQALDPKTERQALQNQAEALQSELNSIKKRLDELEKQSSTD